MTNADRELLPGSGPDTGPGTWRLLRQHRLPDHHGERRAVRAGHPGYAGARDARVGVLHPSTGNGLVDASADLPGPGAVSLPGTVWLTSQSVG